MHLEPIDELVNTVEFFVHHEDVRRAAPGWTPRSLDRQLEDALATHRSGAPVGMLTRKATVGLGSPPTATTRCGCARARRR